MRNNTKSIIYIMVILAILALSACENKPAKSSETTMLASEYKKETEPAPLWFAGSDTNKEQNAGTSLGVLLKNHNAKNKGFSHAPQSTTTRTSNGYVVCIDPGHQARANNDKEPIGPGVSTTKAKVTGGTTGVATGITEYQLTLDVSLMLQKELESRGYKVVMTRTSNDVDISNSERAAVANDAKADAFIRIHANGGGASNQGALTMCQTADNPYNGNLHSQSFALSQAVLNHLCSATGCKNLGVSQVDNMSGINWAKVPVTIVEMGFMSNAEEDRKMADPSYRQKMVLGMADGIEEFLR